MGQVKSITDITSTATGTGLGTPSALTGATFVAAPNAELWPGASSTGFLCQTNSAVALALTIDNTSGANAPFSNGTGSPNIYHRMSVWLRAMRTDNELTTPSSATLMDFITQKPPGTFYRAQIRCVGQAPSSPNTTHVAETSGMTMHVYAGNNVGSAGVYNNTECGFCRDASGLAYAGTPPVNGSFAASAPNFPYETWVRFDLMIDASAGVFQLALNGVVCGFHDFADSMSSGTAGTWPTTWTLTLPAVTGLRWHVGAMETWDDTAASNDTNLTIVKATNSLRQYALTPSFTGARTNAERILTTVANATYKSFPYSLSSGNRPFRERGRFTSTSTSGVNCKVLCNPLANVSASYSDEGYQHVVTAVRFEHDTWSGGIYFNTGLFSADFTITGTGGVMSLKNAAGTTMGTWAVHEQVILIFTLDRNNNCFVTIYNNSKDLDVTSATSLSQSNTSALVATSDTRTTLTFNMVFTTTTNSSSMEYEAVEVYNTPTFTIPDSYSMGFTNGYGGGDGYTYSTFATAPRCNINQSSLLSFAWNGSDVTAASGATYPTGPNRPKWVVPFTFGRTGRKFTNWRDACLAGFNYSRNLHILCVGGFANDMNVTTLVDAQAIAANLADDFGAVASYFIARDGFFTWIRPTFPDIQPNIPEPISPFNGAYSLHAFHLSIAAVTAALATIQKNNPKGNRVLVVDPGFPEFDEGLHWGIAGSTYAMVNATAQAAILSGDSRPGTAQTVSPTPFSSTTKRRTKTVIVSP